MHTAKEHNFHSFKILLFHIKSQIELKRLSKLELSNFAAITEAAIVTAAVATFIDFSGSLVLIFEQDGWV